jgi:hypothetical protein
MIEIFNCKTLDTQKIPLNDHFQIYHNDTLIYDSKNPNNRENIPYCDDCEIKRFSINHNGPE